MESSKGGIPCYKYKSQETTKVVRHAAKAIIAWRIINILLYFCSAARTAKFMRIVHIKGIKVS